MSRGRHILLLIVRQEYYILCEERISPLDAIEQYLCTSNFNTIYFCELCAYPRVYGFLAAEKPIRHATCSSLEKLYMSCKLRVLSSSSSKVSWFLPTMDFRLLPPISKLLLSVSELHLLVSKLLIDISFELFHFYLFSSSIWISRLTRTFVIIGLNSL